MIPFSSILQGFLERKVAPETILDMLRTQIQDEKLQPSSIEPQICNHALESLLEFEQGDHQDALDFLCDHPQFPTFLSLKAAYGLMRLLFKKQYLNQKEIQEIQSIASYINALPIVWEQESPWASALLPYDKNDIQNIQLLIKTVPLSFLQQLKNQSAFQELRLRICRFAPINTLSIRSFSPVLLLEKDKIDAEKWLSFETAQDIFEQLCTSPELTLLTYGVSFYGQLPALRVKPGLRMEHGATWIRFLAQKKDFENAKTSFIAQWIFESSLFQAGLYESTQGYFYTSLTELFNLSCEPQNLWILRGAITAFQTDWAQCALQPPPHPLPFLDDLFLCLIQWVKKDPQAVTSHIVQLVLTYNVLSENQRFFSAYDWCWIRSLAKQVWDPRLEHLPRWLAFSSKIQPILSVLALAPPVWLDTHRFVLFDILKNHSELGVDHVEFVIRVLRKRIPLYATHINTLLILGHIGRASPHEKTQIATYYQRKTIGFIQPAYTATEQCQEALAKLAAID